MTDRDLLNRPASDDVGSPWRPDQATVARLAASGVPGRSALTAFLDETAASPTPPAERLRQLGIALEGEGTGDPAADWARLDAVFARAAEEAPGAVRVAHSWGVSALRYISAGVDASLAATAQNRAQQVLSTALALDPQDAWVHHSLGMLAYTASSSSVTEALGWFERAVALFVEHEPGDPHHVMAQLHVAHCHHDRRDWAAALEAYARVDRVALRREWPAWRERRLPALMAQCWLASGETARARAGVEAILGLFEGATQVDGPDSLDELDELDGLDVVAEIVDGSPLADLAPRVAACQERLARAVAVGDGLVPAPGGRAGAGGEAGC